jgi:serine/threonine protein kinase
LVEPPAEEALPQGPGVRGVPCRGRPGDPHLGMAQRQRGHVVAGMRERPTRAGPRDRCRESPSAPDPPRARPAAPTAAHSAARYRMEPDPAEPVTTTGDRMAGHSGKLRTLGDHSAMRGLRPVGHGTRLTSVSSAWGTALYSAPEQRASCRGVTPSTDIYYYGCILHDLVWGTSRVPFQEYTGREHLGHIIDKCIETDVGGAVDSPSPHNFTVLQSYLVACTLRRHPTPSCTRLCRRETRAVRRNSRSRQYPRAPIAQRVGRSATRRPRVSQ